MTILGKIETPPLFSSRDSYRHLPLVKDIEAVMKVYLHELHTAMTDSGASFGKDKEINEISSELSKAMEDSIPVYSKKRKNG